VQRSGEWSGWASRDIDGRPEAERTGSERIKSLDAIREDSDPTNAGDSARHAKQQFAFGADFWFDCHVTPLRDDVTSLSLSGRGDLHCVRHSLSFRRRMLEGGTGADDAPYWILDP
jgi:hypothetical protein